MSDEQPQQTPAADVANTNPAADVHRESVWDYPRPPRLETSSRRIRVVADGITLADSTRAVRVLETSHPPSWYIPREDTRSDLLTRTERSSTCEWKGAATYWTLHTSAGVRDEIAWSYEHPMPEFESIRGYLAFYPQRVDACFIDDEQVRAEGGDFYGGWLSSDVTLERYAPHAGVDASS